MQRELIRRFANDDATFKAVLATMIEILLRPTGTRDVYILAAEKLLLDKLPIVFQELKTYAAVKPEQPESTQIGL